jgi:hypothetical protein
VPDLTHAEIHEQVRLARELDSRVPRGVRLGTAQLEAIQRHHRKITDQADVGPVTQFMGMKVLPSRSTDRLVLEYDGDPEDADAPLTVTLPVEPQPTPVEEQPAQ